MINLLKEVVLNPLISDNGFNKEYVEQEKKNLIKVIQSRTDNKRAYSMEKGLEEMFKNEPFGWYKYGNISDVKKINEKDLYEFYKWLIKNSRIDFLISGENIEKIEKNDLKTENCEIQNLIDENKNDDLQIKNIIHKTEDVKTKIEQADVAQGNITIGINLDDENSKDEFETCIKNMCFNAVLGGGANSKLFQNVREKNSLCYSVGSRYINQKKTCFMYGGIEIKNFDKALKIMVEQIFEIRNGNVTEKELNEAKKILISGLEAKEEDQDMMLDFEFQKSLLKSKYEIKDYIDAIEKTKIDSIIHVAKIAKIDTIYFLTNE